MQRWTVLAFLLVGCGAGTPASEPAAPEGTAGEAAPIAEGSGPSDDPCTAIAAVEGQGDCDAFFEGAYVDRSTGRCVAGYASGCHATFPFHSIEACRARCEPGAAE